MCVWRGGHVFRPCILAYVFFVWVSHRQTYLQIYMYHVISRLNSPVWGSLLLPNNRYIPPNIFTPVDERFLNRIEYYLGHRILC